MAISTRLKIEGRDVNGRFYKVEVKSEAATEVTAKPTIDIFTLNYEPETDDITSWISPSSAEIYFYEDSDEISTFLNEILDYQQSDFFVEISQSTDGTTYSPYWRGILLQDQILTDDISRPFVITLTAVDGLSLLKDVQYNIANTITLGISRTKINDIIRQSLQLGLATEMWSDTDPFLSTTVNWWENSLTYSATGDPLEDLFFDVDAYKELVEVFGTYRVSGFLSCYDVIRQFCQVFMMRIYMADGRYYLEQVSERANSNIKRVVYDKSGTELSALLTNFDIVLDGTRDSARLAGNQFAYFPAVKRVKAIQNFYPTTGNQQSQFVTLTPDLSLISSVRDWGVFDEEVFFVTGNVPNALSFLTEFSGSVVWTPVGITFTGLVSWYYEVRVKIELDDVNSATNYYWDDNNLTWNTSSTTFYLRSRPTPYATLVGDGTQSYTHNIPHNSSFSTSDLPATGRITITIDGVRVRYSQFNATGTTTATAFQTSGTGGAVVLSLDQISTEGGSSTFNIATSNIANIGDDFEIDLGKIEIGDGRTSTGNILPFDGTNIQRGGNWGRANETADKTLGSLLVSERLRIQAQVLEIYDGVIQYPNGYAYAVFFDSKRYLPLSYSFNAGRCEVEGRYFLIGRNAVVNPDFNDGNEFININLSDGNGSPKFGKSNFFGNILIDRNRVGDVIFDDTETKMLAKASLQAGQKNNYTLIDASPAGSGSIGADATVVKLSWAGADGTFTLEIPQASDMDGQRLEIILNGTFTTGKNVAITPIAGNIQGLTSLEINDAYTRLILRAIDEEWY